MPVLILVGILFICIAVVLYKVLNKSLKFQRFVDSFLYTAFPTETEADKFITSSDQYDVHETCNNTAPTNE